MALEIANELRKLNLLQRLNLTPTLILNLIKAALGLLLSQIFLYIPQFRPLFPAGLNVIGIPYLYVAIITIASHAGMTVGALTDSLILLLNAIIFGLFSAYISSLLSPNIIIMVIWVFLSFSFFLSFRQYGPRWIGFTIYGCLISAFGIIGVIAGGYSSTIEPLVWSAIVSFLIGGLISLSVNIIIVPTFATIQCRSFLKEWIGMLTNLVSGTIRFYDGSDDDVAKLDLLSVQLRDMISKSDLVLGDASNEFNYSKLPFPTLSIIVNMVRDLTNDALGMLISAKTFKNWTKGVKIDKKFDYTKMNEQVAKLCSSLDQLTNSLDIKLNTSYSKTADSDLVDEIIGPCVGFESEVRNLLEFYHSLLDKNDKDWVSKSESILSIYHFSIAVEKIVKKYLKLEKYLDKIHQSKPTFYSPIYRYMPITYLKAIYQSLNPQAYNKNGSFSMLVLISSFSRFLKSNIWTLKSSVCMTLFLMIFVSPESRPVWEKYGLGAGLVTLVIVLTPNMGSAYLAALFQIIGSVLGNSLGLTFFYAFGRYPYVLWIPLVIISLPNFYIMIQKPQFTTIPLLLLIEYSDTTISCWNQDYIADPLKFEYSWIWTRIVVSLLIGLSIGTAFNLFIFPSFAKHELRMSVGNCLVAIEKLYVKIVDVPYYYQARIENGMERADSADVAREETVSIAKDLTDLSNKLFQLRELHAQACLEPEIEMNFDSKKYLDVIESMEIILNGLSGSHIGLEEPWYTQQSVRNAIEGLAEKRNDLVRTMQVLYRLYESSIVMKRILPPSVPSATKVRGELSLHVLSSHLSNSIIENAIDGSLEVKAELPNRVLIEDDLELKWTRARINLYKDENNNKATGIGTLTDIYYYSYVSWMKVVPLANKRSSLKKRINWAKL